MTTTTPDDISPAEREAYRRQREHERRVDKLIDGWRPAILAALNGDSAWEHTFLEGNTGYVIGVPDASWIAARVVAEHLAVVAQHDRRKLDKARRQRDKARAERDYWRSSSADHASQLIDRIRERDREATARQALTDSLHAFIADVENAVAIDAENGLDPGWVCDRLRAALAANTPPDTPDLRTTHQHITNQSTEEFAGLD